LRLYKQRYGLDYIALRYSTVYGERQHHRGVNALHIIESYERIKAGERPVIAGALRGPPVPLRPGPAG